MKEMVYVDEGKIDAKIVDQGNFEGYDWIIVSYGTHPCAYVTIEPGHELFGKKYEKYYHIYSQFNVHGGITYSEAGLHNLIDVGKWVIGWDYNHYDDYNTNMPEFGGHKYTTEEIFQDVVSCISCLHYLYD